MFSGRRRKRSFGHAGARGSESCRGAPTSLARGRRLAGRDPRGGRRREAAAASARVAANENALGRRNGSSLRRCFRNDFNAGAAGRFAYYGTPPPASSDTAPRAFTSTREAYEVLVGERGVCVYIIRVTGAAKAYAYEGQAACPSIPHKRVPGRTVSCLALVMGPSRSCLQMQ